MTAPMRLHTLLADYPVTHALRTGEIGSDLIAFDFAPYEVSNHAFKPMVRELAFDAGELAIATFLQAKDWGKPLTLLPATISGRFQHHCIAYNIERGELRPQDLAGKRVGVRAYTQTTGMWVRGILQNQFGVDLSKVTWLTFEDAHVAEYENPPNVIIAPPDKKLKDMLLDGELDAAMLGSDMPDDPRLRTVVPDPEAAARAWYEKHRAVSVNHMFVVRSDLSRDRPDVVAELFRLLKESKARAGVKGEIDMRPYGFEALRPGLELAIEYCHQQGLVRRRMSVEELFDDTTIGLK
ncbi:phosphate ABC transporter substrate-binding protein [Chelativorans alearense]|uniref:phosphate ABC transporter substrate-binding protein n=1 Tax=Chelativorans alearense TaxID=2681495 RepID=UPI0013D36511|nr:phosphate ABC transporter substrate-binding protein [Chelativorans alearense]